MKYVSTLIIALAMPYVAHAITIDLVTIGNPGNGGKIIAGQGIFGAVSSTYRIGVTEVTNAQYVEFLNAKAATDPYDLYSPGMGIASTKGGITRSGSPGTYTYALKSPEIDSNGNNYTYGDKPVNFVSFYDALRFANWMNNGQGAAASTETGAYTILGGTATPSNANTITRNANAAWFLPSENEWFKAAYYNATTASYFDYPTSSNTTPNNNLPSADTGNSANFFATDGTTGDLNYPMTGVGSYALSSSPYGTFDQGGNVAEWNEATASLPMGARGLRGGSWGKDVSFLFSATRDSKNAGFETEDTGFRLAASIAPPAGVPGDYNNNGIVDAADYVIWRKNLNTSFQLPNEVSGTTPGTVTAEDYNAWRARFGNTSGSGADFGMSAASVPEPATGLLLVFAAMIASAKRRR